MPRIILFDIDDTLFPTTEFAELARRNAIRAMIEMGIRKREDELYLLLSGIIAERGPNYSNHFDILCRRLGERRPARFVAAAVAAYHNTKTAIQPFPTVPRTLLALRESGYKIYVATNGEATKQWDKLIRMQIALFFEDVFVSEELGVEKGPAYFRKVLRALGAKPGECVMVGDKEEFDIIPAKAIGMRTVRMRTGRHAAGKTCADFETREFSGILAIMESLKKGKG
jgi:putative hydrolase of the HAD superfamily